jgi:hypothetical protein
MKTDRAAENFRHFYSTRRTSRQQIARMGPLSHFELLKIVLSALAISCALFAALALVSYVAGLRF